MANWYYSLREYLRHGVQVPDPYPCTGSYNHFCFFSTIESSTKKKDDFAFFIFFTFKGIVV
jgi:hypothetical protein